MSNEEEQKAKFEEDVDDALDILYKSTMNIDTLRNQNDKKSISIMKSTDFNLDKELAQSKITININEIDDSYKYLTTRNWESSDDNKIEYIEKKVEKIYSELDKKKINDLIRQINKCNLQRFYDDFNPKCNNKTIGSISSLDFLIETTYNSHPSHYDIMISDRKELTPYIYKFRSVLGDGDCFYRGFIFSYLENIILTNNIMLMKELLILYYEKINLDNKLVKDKEYLLIFHQMNIRIVAQILYILINQMEKNIETAYIYLLKLFLYCPDFDFGIIFFIRYLIYEYISENEGKIYSKEFQVEIGCLLPEDYVTEKGNRNEYFFENYFYSQLMKPKTFAEKIVLYLIPFVFNVKMNILIYDFGIGDKPSSIQEKKFLCDKVTNSQIEINLLFRKAHYDIFYPKKYYEEYKSYFNILRNIKENIQIINQIEKPKEKENPQLIDDDNDDNISDNEEKNKQRDLDKDNLPRCLECHKPSRKLNELFFLCDECLLTDIKTALLTSYMGFIQKKSNLFNGKVNELFESNTFFKSEVQGLTPITKALNNSKYKLEEIFLDIRSNLCLNCSENLKSKNNYFIKLPCECRICSQNCFSEYIKTLKYYIIADKKKDDDEEEDVYLKRFSLLRCFCGFIYHTFDIINMIQEMDKRKLKVEKELYQDYLKNIWNWRCMVCFRRFRKDYYFNRIYFETDKFDKKLLETKKYFTHLVCRSCLEENNNKNKIIFCSICEFEHTIKKSNEVDENNEEESCVIF